jgi:hypothetical protein
MRSVKGKVKIVTNSCTTRIYVTVFTKMTLYTVIFHIGGPIIFWMVGILKDFS